MIKERLGRAVVRMKKDDRLKLALKALAASERKNLRQSKKWTTYSKHALEELERALFRLRAMIEAHPEVEYIEMKRRQF